MENRVCKLLGIEHPIIQAPMAGTSTVAMAAAVSNAGALGSIALGASNHLHARKLIEEMLEETDAPFSLNFFCHAPAEHDAAREARWLAHLAPFFAEFDAKPPVGLKEIYKSFVEDEDMLDLVLAMPPRAVSFHFGLPPGPYISALKKAGCVLLASATSPAEAKQIEEAGIDIIVAQGYESGGHRGLFEPEKGDPAIGVIELVRAIRKQSALPIVAAGGIMSGQGIADLMAEGADAAQLGTAFILCPESSAHDEYRAAMKSPRVRETVVTDVISGRPARCIPNRLFTDIGAPGHPPLPDYPIAYDGTKALNAAAGKRGNVDFAVNWAGTGAVRAREMPAGELVQVLARELAESKSR
ncbi:MAG TPA: nitronate monooxygenase [Burkholderiaceae bacterium]